MPWMSKSSSFFAPLFLCSRCCSRPSQGPSCRIRGDGQGAIPPSFALAADPGCAGIEQRSYRLASRRSGPSRWAPRSCAPPVLPSRVLLGHNQLAQCSFLDRERRLVEVSLKLLFWGRTSAKSGSWCGPSGACWGTSRQPCTGRGHAAPVPPGFASGGG